MPDLVLLGRIVDHLHAELPFLAAFDFALRFTRAVQRFLARFAAEFRDQPCIAVGQEFRAGRLFALAMHVFDDVFLKRLETDGTKFADGRSVISSREQIRVADDQQRAMLGAVHQPRCGAENDDARAFRPDQRARHIETVFREQLIEVVTGHAPRDSRVPLPHQRRVAIAQIAQLPVNNAALTSFGNDSREFIIARAANAHAAALVCKDVEFLDVIDGFTCHHRVHAARVVADHAADRAVLMRRRIGSERELVFFSGVIQVIPDDTRLNARDLRLGIERKQSVQVFGKVDNDGDVAGLPGEAGTAAPSEDGHPAAAALFDSRNHIIDGSGNHHADWRLAVNRKIGGVQRARARVKANFAFNAFPQSGRKVRGFTARG